MRSLVFVLMMSCAAGSVGGGGAAGQEWDAAAHLDPQILAALRPVLNAAVRDSLPLAALESKILEGVAKGIEVDRIREVAMGLANELHAARSGLRNAFPDAPLAGTEVSAAALAMRHGVPLESLLALWEARPPSGSLEIPLVVVGELARRGGPVDMAVETMTNILGSPVPLDLAAQIPARMDQILPTTGTPAAALVEALRSLRIPPAPPGRRPGGRG